MNYMIGIDSGGTKTEAIAYDLNGSELARCQTGFGNLLIDKKRGLANLEEAMKILFDKLDEKYCQIVVVGLAGLDGGNFKAELATYFSHYQPDIVFINDAWLSYYALVKEKDGCLVISGTGSICIGQKVQETARVGGWGNLLGDEGSGYWIAKKMIQQLLKEEDRSEGYSSLSKKLMSALEAKNIFDVVSYTYTHEKDQIAQLATLVAESAIAEDPWAIELLEAAGRELANQIKLLIATLGFTQQVTIGLSGSVLEKNPIVYQSFSEVLAQLPIEICLITEAKSNASGGYYYYKNKVVGNEE